MKTMCKELERKMKVGFRFNLRLYDVEKVLWVSGEIVVVFGVYGFRVIVLLFVFCYFHRGPTIVGGGACMEY